jgi:hypothetical protein
MAVAEASQHFCDLLGRGDSNIGDQAAVQRFRVIKVEDAFGKIRKTMTTNSLNARCIVCM